MPRSAETAGRAMLTMVASRMTSRTVMAMTPRASHRLGYGSSPTWPAPEARVDGGSVMGEVLGGRAGEGRRHRRLTEDSRLRAWARAVFPGVHLGHARPQARA